MTKDFPQSTTVSKEEKTEAPSGSPGIANEKVAAVDDNVDEKSKATEDEKSAVEEGKETKDSTQSNPASPSVEITEETQTHSSPPDNDAAAAKNDDDENNNSDEANRSAIENSVKQNSPQTTAAGSERDKETPLPQYTDEKTTGAVNNKDEGGESNEEKKIAANVLTTRGETQTNPDTEEKKEMLTPVGLSQTANVEAAATTEKDDEEDDKSDDEKMTAADILKRLDKLKDPPKPAKRGRKLPFANSPVAEKKKTPPRAAKNKNLAESKAKKRSSPKTPTAKKNDTPTMSTSKKNGDISTYRHRKCICSWPDCDKIRDQILDTCDPSDLWYGAPYRVDKKTSDSEKCRAFRACIAHYVPGAADYLATCKDFSIARHHWPRAYLHYLEGMAIVKKVKSCRLTTLLKRAEVDSLAEKDGQARIKHKGNLVSSLLKEDYQDGKMLTKKQKQVGKKYVMAPCTTREEIHSFLGINQTERAMRRKKYEEAKAAAMAAAEEAFKKKAAAEAAAEKKAAIEAAVAAVSAVNQTANSPGPGDKKDVAQEPPAKKARIVPPPRPVSPPIMPPLELCIAKVIEKCKKTEVADLEKEKNFVGSVDILRRIYKHFNTPIKIEHGRYIFLCPTYKENESCSPYFFGKYYSENRMCPNCYKLHNRKSAREKKRKELGDKYILGKSNTPHTNMDRDELLAKLELVIKQKKSLTKKVAKLQEENEDQLRLMEMMDDGEF